MTSTQPTASPEIFATRRTLDGYRVLLCSDGDITDGRGTTFTRAAALPMSLAWLVVEAVGLFDVAEMPAVMRAAGKATRRAVAVDFWGLVDIACNESEKSGTRPADMPRPVAPRPKICAWTPDEIRALQAGFIVCPKHVQ